MSIPAQSIIVQTMNMVAEQVGSLNLMFATPPATVAIPVPVVVKYLPRRSANQDPPTLITIWRTDQPEKTTYAAFRKQWKTFLIYVSIITPGNQDLLSNYDLFHVWRQQIEKLFEPDGPNADQFGPPLFGIPNLFEVRVIPDVFLPRQQLAIQYNEMATGLQFRSQGS